MQTVHTTQQSGGDIALFGQMSTHNGHAFMVLSLQHVMQRVADKAEYSPEFLLLLEEEFRRYMMLCAVFPDEILPPSRLVDSVWHEALMFTRDYQHWCEMGAGRFIHHEPSRSEADSERFRQLYFGNTLPRYRSLFGEPPAEVWPTNGTGVSCTDCGDCGDCG